MALTLHEASVAGGYSGCDVSVGVSYIEEAKLFSVSNLSCTICCTQFA